MTGDGARALRTRKYRRATHRILLLGHRLGSLATMADIADRSRHSSNRCGSFTRGAVDPRRTHTASFGVSRRLDLTKYPKMCVCVCNDLVLLNLLELNVNSPVDMQ
jgi:hypothetical protein